jgi:DNA-binding FadR family transcriptional regulator
LPLEAIEPRRLYRLIADQLRNLIDQGEYPVGSRLPSERELADTLGVSRPTVREALIALEVEGRLRIRVGSGVYVTAPQAGAALAAPLPMIEGPFEVLRARAFVESAVAEEAARLATPADIARLDAVLAEIGPELTREHWVDVDRRFHRAVVAPLGNVVLLRTVCDLFDQRVNPYFVQLSRHVESEAAWRLAHQEHLAVRDAIAARNPARAKTAMRNHLERSHERFARDFGEVPGVERDGEAKPARAVPRRKGVNPVKARKEPHKAAAC